MAKVNAHDVNLKVPLTNSQYDYLNGQFRVLFEECAKKAGEYLKQAEDKETGAPDTSSTFEHDPTILKAVKIYKFFFDHHLLENAK